MELFDVIAERNPDIYRTGSYIPGSPVAPKKTLDIDIDAILNNSEVERKDESEEPFETQRPEDPEILGLTYIELILLAIILVMFVILIKISHKVAVLEALMDIQLYSGKKNVSNESS